MTTLDRSRPGLRRTAWVMALAAAGFSLSACDRQQETTVGQKVDSAVERTEQVARNGAEQAKESMNSATGAARELGDKAAAVIDDSAITAAVSAGLAKDPDLSAIRVDVDTKNGVVTLKGPAPTPGAKERASRIAQDVKGVASVDNQLVVGAG